MLGSSFGAVEFAMKKGLGYVFAAHLSPELAIPVLRSYREKFEPSKYLKEPKSILSIPVITAETEEEAKYLAGPMELLWARMGTGSSNLAIVSPEAAANHKYTNAERAAYNKNKKRYIIGDIKTVAQKLRELAKEAVVDEIMLVDFFGEQEGRLKAYTLLSEEFLINHK
ncbi:alkanesulfonate monooxygenase SsuD/methylene tetrahydromethanopterin reductase-like flavin-dependent oxidoreductase (luciferase family) [Neobacillus niacini]|uniref:LLM class flavin-dependent oxidoreductase n=1 Tax=Neobacillus niacini TaxID=86668 RepID=UPI002783A8EF|nr:LLM class flavin-dependent oxidoreductase [Neobacillus niacini]MDQ1005344.1 alkanesulfonate monooxygenase SsuD/methylene tetrahydromethanopterin reductase-like flavin-dependent oxidoreductase (luciferase family) [Neobacillus niacini]